MGENHGKRFLSVSEKDLKCFEIIFTAHKRFIVESEIKFSLWKNLITYHVKNESKTRLDLQ